MSEACGEMNLAELKAEYPELFYSQDWYVREAFMRCLPDPDRRLTAPRGAIRVGRVPPLIGNPHRLPHAVDLAHAFVLDPNNPAWQHYYWCADVDSFGQRIYLGAVCCYGLLEIHRHLNVTERWGEPSWR